MAVMTYLVEHDIVDVIALVVDMCYFQFGGTFRINGRLAFQHHCPHYNKVNKYIFINLTQEYSIHNVHQNSQQTVFYDVWPY